MVFTCFISLYTYVLNRGEQGGNKRNQEERRKKKKKKAMEKHHEQKAQCFLQGPQEGKKTSTHSQHRARITLHRR
jgi:hypothetical protein